MAATMCEEVEQGAEKPSDERDLIEKTGVGWVEQVVLPPVSGRLPIAFTVSR